MQPFCVYVTEYTGKAFNHLFGKDEVVPHLYIGCCQIIHIEKEKYVGSVKSTKYIKIWLDEQKKNFDCFNVTILKKFDNLKDAQDFELKLQIEHDVVKNPHFFNKMLNICHTFGGAKHGKYHSAAKKFIVTPPGGTPQVVHGEISHFCKRNNLSYSTLRNFVNRGAVRKCEFQKKFVRDTGRNCIGWQITTAE